ncbi:MAG: ral secretion pathway protein [Deferribacteraceae bacterium]|nr:ral secretion pathway protein [Deferribacteraceae bacterium]
MKRFFILLIMLVSFYSIAADIDAQFKNVSLKDFLLFVSEFTGKSVVYDENSISGNLTIQSNAKLSKENLLEIMHSVLSVNGYYAVDKGNYLQVLKKQDIKEYNEDLYDGNKKSSTNFVTAVITLDNLELAKVAQSLVSIKSKFGSFQIVKEVNAIVVSDETERILKIKEILNEMEKYANDFEFKSFIIKNTTATSLENKLKEFYKQLATQGLLPFNPVTISDDYTNTLIIGAKPNEMAKAEYLIEKLDSSATVSATKPQVYNLKNVQAEDVEKILNKLLATMVDPKDKKSISSKVASDKSTNSIIALGDKELYDNIAALIEKLDVPRKQVYIEALILETSIENGANFGVEWLAGGGNSNAAGSVGFLNGGNLTNFQAPVLDGESPNFAALPGGFTASILGNVISYEGVKFPTLSALVNFIKTDSSINIISNPQILTLDNEEAEVFVGENRPFVTSTKYDSNNSNPVSSYDYRDVGVRLKVTPHIADNETLTLKVEQEVKKVIANATSADLTAPITLTRQTKTNVELINGYTMVISGLIGDDTSVSNSEVPGLSKIPLIGWLFKSKSRSDSKTNMMVFISAQIINTRDDLKLITAEKMQYQQMINKEQQKVINGK